MRAISAEHLKEGPDQVCAILSPAIADAVAGVRFGGVSSLVDLEAAVWVVESGHIAHLSPGYFAAVEVGTEVAFH